MKVLYSCLSKSWGGMEMVTLSAIKQLQKRHIHVELLCISESRIHIEANNIGMIIHPVNASGYFHPYITLRLASIIYRGEYDLIHTQASKDLWLLVPALKLLRSKIPLILTKHVGSGIIKKDRFHRWIYERLTLALAISRVIKKNLLDTCPLPENKVRLLHNGIDTEKFDPDKISGKVVRKEFNINSDEIIIGMLARFSPGKGHEEFLSAAEQLNTRYKNLKYLIVGEASRGENTYADSIKQLAEKHNLSNVIFTGYRSDTPQVIAGMDIFVFPSHSEAFGIALAEAMSMAKPSVCSNSDGVLDIAVDNETSYLFERKNADDLARKIEILINSPDIRIQFGKAARNRAVENFNLDILTDKVINIYNELSKK
ncbi:MAG: glycosyltransferase family 4 protein [Ignavibacteriaceae bacterium]|nr:glycosyltransferase family 4 protein [Ignavibacteriaceae bacterium]